MAGITPMLQQYLDIKVRHPQDLVFFRLGDFYELFNDDALIASKELEIVLTGREAGRDIRVPMCGVPHHAATQYIGKLLERGYRVAVCEQIEDPATAKGLVAREVVRVYTPGTVLEDGLLPKSGNNFLTAIALDKGSFGLAAADLSTGEFMATEIKELGTLLDELDRLSPAELLLEEEIDLPEGLDKVHRVVPACYKDTAGSFSGLAGHYGLATAEAMGLKDWAAAARAAFAVLAYLEQTQSFQVQHLQWPRPYRLNDLMYLDANTRRNLELTRTLRDGRIEGTLLWVLDQTVTSAGARTLRSWIDAPLAMVGAIERRLDAVGELAGDLDLRQEIRALLRESADLPRLAARLSCGGGNGRDLLSLGRTLSLLPDLHRALERTAADALVGLREELAPLPEISAKIMEAVSPDAPSGVKEGGIFKHGYDELLDELRAAAGQGRDWMAALEKRERERTGIKSLKIGYNQVFGYYIEVTNANLPSVPTDYTRRQTLANAERFITGELKEFEQKILGAEEKARSLEYELFVRLRDEVVSETKRLQRIGNALGGLDALVSLGEVAVKNGYTRPIVSKEGRLCLIDARHPVVERCLAGGMFVPNDTELDPGSTFVQVITGPNMSGKSTYLRQTALIVLLAHMGSFVPAASAEVGLTDRIFTRIGAADDLAGGRSTFLVEMTETAEILRAATNKSLLILDEIGRGTGTLDGQAIARAVLEYIHDRVKAKALFATHYHELTSLAAHRPGIANGNVAVTHEGDELVFEHRLRPGAADRSYGIEVARLAGLPPAVLARARQLELEAETNGQTAAAEDQPPVRQLSLFTAPDDEIRRRLSELDLQKMTPLEALNWLWEAQKQLRHKRQRFQRQGGA